VAKVLKRRRDGTLEFQWYGNLYNDVFGGHLPGWFNKTDKTIYWSAKPVHYKHEPYTNVLTDTLFSEKNAYTPGFKLLPDDTIPVAVLKILSDSEFMPWCLPDFDHKDLEEYRQKAANKNTKKRSSQTQNKLKGKVRKVVERKTPATRSSTKKAEDKIIPEPESNVRRTRNH
jgi:hypothetical protein